MISVGFSSSRLWVTLSLRALLTSCATHGRDLDSVIFIARVFCLVLAGGKLLVDW